MEFRHFDFFEKNFRPEWSVEEHRKVGLVARVVGML